MTVRYKLRASGFALLASASIATLGTPANAEGYLQPFTEGRNNLHRNITGDDLTAFATTLRESNRIVIDVEMENIVQCTTQHKRCLRFHLVSAPNPDNRKWELVGGVEKELYNSRWQVNRDRGYRPTDIESVNKHVTNAGGRGGSTKVYYAGLWIENRERLAWASFAEIDRSRFNKEFRERVRDGSMVLVDREATGFRGQKIAAIFVRPRADHQTSRWRPTKAEYAEDAARIFAPGGGWPLYMQTGTEYDISLRKDDVREARVFTALNNQQLQNRLATARSDGFEIVDIERNGGNWLVVFLRSRSE